ncbi:GDYXXLXY domain-containing protein [Flavobacterium agricola]|uniref:GDYXXLXY domain-containing protein n=1 Tax=Flavobacterium agricola TaxID=2870839 RepID=A0ABY6LZZ2_9FLAO|nr:GDYXXLXY domain-containing protein [Flavobacterium agricola]UYW00730.1 GDYXXLXY domain-containing protein [Flavobacterium agricola]
MKKIKLFLITINLVLVGGYFLNSVKLKEQTLSQGKLLLLQLAPVDPRSLMQGDYMVLNYAVNNELPDNIPSKGYVIFEKDSTANYKPILFTEQFQQIPNHQIILKYTHQPNDWNNGRIKLGAESYFFEEGQADKFAEAVFGGLKVDEKGNSILVGLYDKNKIQIE